MLLEQTDYWTRIEAYVLRPPSLWQLQLARVQWRWLQWRAGAEDRRQSRVLARLRAADLPDYLRRDIGLM